MKNHKKLLIILLILALVMSAAYYFTMSKDYAGRVYEYVVGEHQDSDQSEPLSDVDGDGSTGPIIHGYDDAEYLDTKDSTAPDTVDRKKFTPETSGPKGILGCMDKAACNYNKEATEHDFKQCIFPDRGKTCEGQETDSSSIMSDKG